MDYIAFGQRIRRFRKQKRLTQEALAEQVGISASFMGHIERGSRIASIDTLMQLCHVLGVTPNDLLGSYSAVLYAELPEQIIVSPAAFIEEIVMLMEKQEIPQ